MGVIARMVVVAVLVAVLTVNITQTQKGYGMADTKDQGIGLLKKIADILGFSEKSEPERIINYLKEKGYSDKAVAGILANIELETGGTFDYQQKEKDGNAYGLFQYDFMKPYYEDYLEREGKDDSMEAQIDYMDDVVKGNEQMLGGKERAILKGELFSGKFEPDRIAKSFNSIFEKGKLETEYGNREDLANKIYEDYF
tara:strand:+ start:124 stop:717 length:594 start_codon:yes stop_codon:yes gene_type:complete